MKRNPHLGKNIGTVCRKRRLQDLTGLGANYNGNAQEI
jgi:hypothetical protein